MPLPPLWALGNQQSRWSYYPGNDGRGSCKRVSPSRFAARRRASRHRLHARLPGLYFRQGKISGSKRLERQAWCQGIKLVTIVDPGIKQPQDKNERYHAYDEGRAKNFFNDVAMAISSCRECGRVRVFSSTTQCPSRDAGGATCIVLIRTTALPASGTI